MCGLYCYLRKDYQALDQILKNTNSPQISLLLETRKFIAEFTLKKSALKKLEKEIDFGILSEDIWKGETYFILGMGWCEVEEYEISKKFYQMAYSFFWKTGLKRKAIKCLFNIIVSESRIKENKKLIVDYGIVAKKALEINDAALAGICYHNISQRFRDMGAIESSLKYANKAIEHLELEAETTAGIGKRGIARAGTRGLQAFACRSCYPRTPV